MKGIIVAGGNGTRLYPITYSINKHVLPIYDKPMIYYPLSTLMLMGINDILIISDKYSHKIFKDLLGDGSNIGCNIQYATQNRPEGVGQAFSIADSFIGNDNVCLILGDNIFYGKHFPGILRDNKNNDKNATVFAYHVNDPERYGVIEFDNNERPISIQEKPQEPRSNYAIAGIYFYDSSVVDVAKNLEKSNRGEYEITDINEHYLKNNSLEVQILDRGVAWLDTGTFSSLMEAGQFVQIIEKRQGYKIGCIEEVAYKMGYIDENKAFKLSHEMDKSGYGDYIRSVIEKKKWRKK